MPTGFAESTPPTEPPKCFDQRCAPPPLPPLPEVVAEAVFEYAELPDVLYARTR
jgi:hypothetical protein